MSNPLHISGGGSGNPVLLRDRWQEHSKQAGWRYPGDWLVPEVDGVIRACQAARALPEAARLLGAARAYHGVGVKETMVDMSAFFSAAELPVCEETMRDLVEGWTFESERIQPIACVDPRTGLPTLAHFEQLLLDLSLYGLTQQGGAELATLALEWDSYPLGWDVLADIGQILKSELTPVRGKATLHESRIYILLDGSAAGRAAVERCVRRVDAIRGKGRGKTVMSVAALPGHHGSLLG